MSQGSDQLTLIDVVVPGPWWNSLSYEYEGDVKPGVRVLVPMGPSKRVGFSLGRSSGPSENKEIFRIRSLIRPLDEETLFPNDLWLLSHWIGVNFLCGRGEALRVMSPSQLLKGEATEPIPPSGVEKLNRSFTQNYYYFSEDEQRHKRYVDILRNNQGSAILLFPERALAELFYSLLETQGFEKVLLWPSVGGKKLWEAWNKACIGDVNIIVGGPGAVFAPLCNPELILVDEESSPAYRLQSVPFLQIRSVAVQRARIAKSSLYLCGRLPSSKIFLHKKPEEQLVSPEKRAFFVDTKFAPKPDFPGISSSFPLSESLVRETMKCLGEKRTALWILDRKGYAGEITCEECGGTLVCHSCGVALRAEEEAVNVTCPLCGYKAPFPKKCPKCGGFLLSGKRPGLEIVLKIAQALCGEGYPVVEWHAEKNTSKKRLREINAHFVHGGIVVGSRAALSLCDSMLVGMIGWIDADAEARKVVYRSKFDAYRMVLESFWRGREAAQRRVIIQSRRPGKGWQRGILEGWTSFWYKELKERQEYGFPPFSILAEITPPPNKKEELLDYLVEKNIMAMDPGGKEKTLWIFVERPGKLKKVLEPWFNISKSREGFPLVSLWID